MINKVLKNILGDGKSKNMSNIGYRKSGSIPNIIENKLLVNGPTKYNEIVKTVASSNSSYGKNSPGHATGYALYDMTKGYYQDKPIVKVNSGTYDLSPKRRKELSK